MTSRAGRREWIGLAVLILPILIASMDVSVLFFAVPFIAQDLQPTATQQLWIFDIYGFVLAGLLLTMGSVGDRIGRRRLLLIGAVAFSAASLLAAYAQSAEMLIAARAVLGIAGATLMPSTLALIRNLFHDEADRTKAVAIWSAALTGGVTVGPIISGVLLEHFWWGSVFLINLPAMLLLLVGVAFVRRQLTADVPMLDVRALAERRFGGSGVVNVLAMFAVMGNAVILTQYLQSVVGLSPLAAALWSLVPSVVVGAAAPLAAVLAPRFGRPAVMAGGFVVSMVGFLLISRVEPSGGLWLLLAAAGLVSGGLVAVLSLITDYVVGVAPAERAGSVAGLVETSSELGGALGMALLGSVLAAVYRLQADQLLPAGLPASASAEAGQTLAGAVAVSDQLPPAIGEAVLAAGRAAYTSAMHVACLTAAGVLVAATVVTLVLLRGADGSRTAVEEPAHVA